MDDHGRHRLVGWWAAAGGVGVAAGPLLGGALVALASGPVAAVAIAAALGLTAPALRR
ncbi:hypothetical protein [Amycolatopsis thermophila]|uniref:MFS family permease n=1 Tax=Amycolatopsis thermophila TaxID=206084 RepID=A0ABU0ELT1_9PSEU|nr:hypothetical protein [Amycolatopsis thermophila]MDQ0376248.1 MFS family permease [Amycolatopsis thermophila]